LRADGPLRALGVLRHHRELAALESEAAPLKSERPRDARGLSTREREGVGLPGLDAAAVGVRPLVLVAESAGADERRRRPRALVVRFVAGAVEPRIAEGVGDGLTSLVANEVLLILRKRPTGNLAAAAA